MLKTYLLVKLLTAFENTESEIVGNYRERRWGEISICIIIAIFIFNLLLLAQNIAILE